MGSYAGNWANGIEICPHSIGDLNLPCHFGQNRSFNPGSQWNEKS